jgi:GNAT superfamily N-acetyltransferase
MKITTHTDTSTSEYQAQLNDLMDATFGLRFDLWIALKQWTADYTCYSVIEDGVMQANAAVYRMQMLVGGEEKTYLQVGAVATRKERRGQGLSRAIMERILADYLGMPFFLFANPNVVNFYPRFGFKAVFDRQPRARVNLSEQPGVMRRLMLEDPLVGRYLYGRGCFSSILDCKNAAPVNWFNLLMGHADNVYEIPALELMLAAERNGNVLTIYDIWAKKPLAFEELASSLDFPGVQEIRFGFNPDWLQLDYEWIGYAEEDTTIFARGCFQDAGDYIIPLLLRT